MTSDLPSFPAANESPLDTCIRLREIAPVVEVEFPGGVPVYLALTHQAAREILAGDNKSFLRHPRHWPALHDGSIPEDWPLRSIVQGGNLGAVDGGDHRRLRGLIGTAFTPARVQAMQPRIQQIIDGLLDDVAAAGDGVDLVPTFTEALPIQVICELFGVPAEDRPRLRRWTAALVAHPTTPETAFAAQQHLLSLLHALVERKQREPGDDLISGLVAARDKDDRGDKPTADEVVGVLWVMLLAGHETTLHLLGHAIIALARDPAQLALAKSGNRWADVVEEAVRHRHPVLMVPFRFTAQDVSIAGVPIPQGNAVGVCYQACGIDPTVYGDNAGAFDLTREQNGHLGFGHGPRYCIGAGLARLESRLALASLYRRFPALTLAVHHDDIPHTSSLFTNGPLSLPVNLAIANPSDAGNP
ncbi:cytochrome P450 [Nonomuraea sp. NPDC026600]|uniref:cytochrome P450 family protein n=1 Tax=Nonomuraea sp. NPDC026600 TaxID=3155363 RepID=UPI0033E05696